MIDEPEMRRIIGELLSLLCAMLTRGRMPREDYVRDILEHVELLRPSDHTEFVLTDFARSCVLAAKNHREEETLA